LASARAAADRLTNSAGVPKASAAAVSRSLTSVDFSRHALAQRLPHRAGQALVSSRQASQSATGDRS
jgi:hypothetical protein